MKKTALVILLLSSQYLFISAQDFREMKNKLLYANDTAKARLLNDLGTAFYDQDDFDSSKKYGILALQLVNKILNSDAAIQNNAYQLHCKRLKAKALENVGSSLMFENINAANDSLQLASVLWNETGNKTGMASAYQRLGQLNMTIQHNFPNALKYFDKSLTLHEQMADQQNIGKLYYDIALAERYMHRYSDAFESNTKALAIAKDTYDTVRILKCLLSNGFIYMMVKNYPEALKVQQAALNISVAAKDSGFISSSYNDMGIVNMRAGNWDIALKNHLTALNIRKQANLLKAIGTSYIYIAQILSQQGNYTKAIASYLEGLNSGIQSGNQEYIPDFHYGIARNYFKLNDYGNALNNYDTTLQVSTKLNNIYYRALALEGMADIYLKQGKTGRAIELLKKAATIADTSNYAILRAVYETLSTAYSKNGDYKNAYESSIKYKIFSDSAASIEKTGKLISLTNQLEFESKKALIKAAHDMELATQKTEIQNQKLYRNITIAGLCIMIILAIISFIRFRQKKKLNIALETTLSELKSAQAQLIQSEKMVSLGELSAGIAHEIQNPLNFVNNFSEINKELLAEMNTEIEIGNYNEVKVIAKDITDNEEKINQHGKRADAIVKGMLQHSRSSSATKELTDINKLSDEYLRLAYHGIRAKDKFFNVTMKTDFDESIGNINIIPQDIGRVILNLITNAFYVVNEKKKSGVENYEPVVKVITKKLQNKVKIIVVDNGNGIPAKVLNKIFQPFFTTKPTGQGTGLGLSLSYDIVKAHGGDLKVETKEGEGSEFIILLPLA